MISVWSIQHSGDLGKFQDKSTKNQPQIHVEVLPCIYLGNNWSTNFYSPKLFVTVWEVNYLVRVLPLVTKPDSHNRFFQEVLGSWQKMPLNDLILPILLSHSHRSPIMHVSASETRCAWGLLRRGEINQGAWNGDVFCFGETESLEGL